MPKYRKLVKHKRKPRKETTAFSKNSSKVIKKYPDGSESRQSHLSGRVAHYNPKGREVKKLSKYH